MKRKLEGTYLKITTSKLYFFEPKYCNGWPIERVIQEWFDNYPIDSYHAARDGARIGNSKKLVSIETLKETDIKGYLK